MVGEGRAVSAERQAVLSLAPLRRVRGEIHPPGDKSISHRALLLGAAAMGESRLRRLSVGDDVQATRAALQKLGAEIRDRDGELVIRGRGWAGLHQDPGRGLVMLDCGNSGTTARLLLGLLAGGRGEYLLRGDESLARRPMGRVTSLLAQLGARIEGGERLPLTVTGAPLRGGTLSTPVPSAQVKSAVVLAALQAAGDTTLAAPAGTRDHTERLLGAMGLAVSRVDPAPDQTISAVGATAPGEDAALARLTITGGAPRLTPLDLDLPGDPSASAYALALACRLPDSEIIARDVSVNPTRLGFHRLLQRMGANVSWETRRDAPEPMGVIVARTSELRGIQVAAAEVVDAIDEIPLLAVIAAVSQGETVIRGAGELRVKESDRLAATVELLRAFGAAVEVAGDNLIIQGVQRFRPARVDAKGDHRIAMCAAVAASLASGPSELTGGEWVRISHPDFFTDLERISS